jgi:hypothetical protein
MLPVNHRECFSLYVVDFEDKHLLVMDPTETSETMHEMQCKHEAVAKKVLRNLRKCINELIYDWKIINSFFFLSSPTKNNSMRQA